MIFLPNIVQLIILIWVSFVLCLMDYLGRLLEVYWPVNFHYLSHWYFLDYVDVLNFGYFYILYFRYFYYGFIRYLSIYKLDFWDFYYSVVGNFLYNLYVLNFGNFYYSVIRYFLVNITIFYSWDLYYTFNWDISVYFNIFYSWNFYYFFDNLK